MKLARLFKSYKMEPRQREVLQRFIYTTGIVIKTDIGGLQ